MVAFLLYLSIQTALMWKCGNKKDSAEKMYPNLLLRGFKLLGAECIKDWHHRGFIRVTFLVVSVDNNEQFQPNTNTTYRLAKLYISVHLHR